MKAIQRNHLAPILSILLLCHGGLNAAPGDVDPSFDPGSGVDRDVYFIVTQADGKIIIGGDFRTVRGAVRNRIARLNADGTADLAFDPGAGANGLVSCIGVQTDGKVVIGGRFTAVNLTNRNRIARLNADGSLDPTFDPGSGAEGPFAHVRAIVIQPDGKILVGGDFRTMDGTSRNAIARLNADGSLDTTFAADIGVFGAVHSITLQTDGQVLVGGGFSTVNGAARNCIARLNTNGTLDTTFDPGPGAEESFANVFAITVQPDGSVLVGGEFSLINGTNWNAIARLNSDGSLDATFNPATELCDNVRSISVQTDGKILLGGGFFDCQEEGVGIRRLNADGTLDSAFRLDANTSFFFSVAIQSNGRILAGGEPRFRSEPLVRFNADGSLDGEFAVSTRPNAGINAVIVDRDGKVVIGGEFTSVAGVSRNRVARLNADGSLDRTFKPGAGANDSVGCVAVAADGKVTVTGWFTTIDGISRSRIARLNPDGSLDSAFNASIGSEGVSSDIYALALQPDGKVVLGGSFTNVGAAYRNHIARLEADGSLDATFDPGSGAEGRFAYVQAIAIQPNGKVLVTGYFTRINGTDRNGIARLNSDGSLDDSFDPGTGIGSFGRIYSMALQPDGKVLVAGSFRSINGITRPGIARLNTDGSLDDTFNPSAGPDGFNLSVGSIALQADGKVLLVGEFTSVNSISHNRIARLNADGTLDETFNPGSGIESIFESIAEVAVQSDGGVLVAGEFTSINGVARWNIARLFGDGRNVSPIPLNIRKQDDQLELSWDDPAFLLQSAPLVTGPYSDVVGGISPYFKSIAGLQQYFRLRAN